MANPQVENGYVKISNEIFDALAHTRIPGEARQVLDVILRKTYGWNKKADQISLTQFMEHTGLSKVHVCQAINKLEKMNLIIREAVTEKGNDSLPKKVTLIVTYGLQKNFDEWKPLPKKVTVTEKGNKSLPNSGTSKDTNTKDKKNMSFQNRNDIPYRAIIDLYHRILPELPAVLTLTTKRKTHIKARWLSRITSRGGRAVATIEFWEAYFNRVRDSGFLMGENNRGWKASLDFLVSEKAFIKIIESHSDYFVERA